jgi:multimeric flavodoxin WrbA
MAKILLLLTSARKNGFTAGLLKEAATAAEKIPGVTVEILHAFDYKFGPCNSCFSCIRHSEKFCSLDDDMGQNGKGDLFAKLMDINGLIIAQPVHFWGSAAMTHLFIERLYPFLSHNTLHGLPFASISCACNQGMMRLAEAELAKWAFTLKFLHIESLPVHTVYYEKAQRQAHYLGEKIALAALEDEKEGRQHLSDEESWFYYMDKPWNALEPYLDNLTLGTFSWQDSMIEYALSQNTVNNPESRLMLEEARTALIETLNAWNLQDMRTAQKLLLKASALWTHATFLEASPKLGINVNIPQTYRPLQ